ncbi:MAG: hypothetical protein ACRC33_18645 [Gemmataceae bacterium]
MDQDTLGVTELTNVEQGAAVLRSIADAGIDVSAACWVKLEGAGWWFVVVSKTADEAGSAQAFLRAYEVLERLGVPAGRRGLLRVVRTDDPLGADVLAMRRKIERGELFFTGTAGGHDVEEVYVYPADLDRVGQPGVRGGAAIAPPPGYGQRV